MQLPYGDTVTAQNKSSKKFDAIFMAFSWVTTNAYVTCGELKLNFLKNKHFLTYLL
jgi:hypothetical protein